MFKFTTALCFLAVVACAVARPGLVSPLAYSAYPAASPYVAAPYAAQLGYSAPFVAPYASSYNAHQIDHSVAYPAYPYAAYAAAPAAYAAAPAAYAAAPAAYAAAPAAYAAGPAAYAGHLLK